MKYLLTLLMLCGIAYGQCGLTLTDTAFNNAVSLITYSSARVNSDVTNGDVAGALIVFKYVRTGHTDTVTTTTAWPIALRNLTGLVPSTQYKYYYTIFCGSGGVAQIGRYTFTTLANTITYTPQFNNYQYPYVKFDSGLKIPRGDTSLYRAPNTGGDLMFKNSDGNFYGYDGTRWKPLAFDSAGIMPALTLKVDSVTVSGDSLFWWCCGGVAHGQVVPTAVAWNLTGNTGTSDATNFIGTTDGQDLVIKTNGSESMRITGDGNKSVTISQAIPSGGILSFAGGNGTISSGYETFVFGEGSIATGNQSFAFGEQIKNEADYTFVTGDADTAKITASAGFIAGFNNVIYGNGSMAMGGFLKSKSYGGSVIGTYNDSTNATDGNNYNALNRAFQIGIGTADNARANAMTVLFSGKTTLNKYGAGTFTGTSAKYLQVNSSGDIIEGSNVIPIANGGTNNGSLSVTAGTLYYGDGSKLVGLGIGTAAQTLHVVSGLPAWRDTATGGSSSLTATYIGYGSGANALTGTSDIIRAAAGVMTLTGANAALNLTASSGTAGLTLTNGASASSVYQSAGQYLTLGGYNGVNQAVAGVTGTVQTFYTGGSFLIAQGIGGTPTSTLHTFGSFATNYVAVTGTYSITVYDYTVDCTANTFTATLPTAVGCAGRIYFVTNSGAGTITLATTSSQTFANVVATPTTLPLATLTGVVVQSNGANWLKVSSF